MVNFIAFSLTDFTVQLYFKCTKHTDIPDIREWFHA